MTRAGYHSEGVKSRTPKTGLSLISKVCIGIAVLLVVLGFAVAGVPWLIHASPSLGDFGSFLQGTTASLWSLASVVLIFVAFLVQSEQLKAQKEQFELEQQSQAEELLRQNERFQKQQRSIELQNFENAFFQLLGVHNQIATSIQLLDSERKVFAEGREALKMICDMLQEEIPSKLPSDRKARYDLLNVTYVHFYYRHQHMLGHYFRNLYHILKFVNEAEVLEDLRPEKDTANRRRYTSLVRAQLSAYEQVLIFYNCLSDYGKKDFKPLIEKFGLFEHLEITLMPHCEIIEFYEESAFK